MANREQFLGRVRDALRQPPGSPLSDLETWPPLGPVLDAIPADALVDRFEAELQKVGGATFRAASIDELDATLRKLTASTTSVVLSRNPLLSELCLADRLRAMGQSVAAWPPRSETVTAEAERAYRECAFAAGVGITGVDLALAESGTLVLTSFTEGSQLTSLAPPVHVALYRRAQVVGSLEEVLSRLPIPPPSQPASMRSVVFITGASRTADIEQILVRGVHGPGEVAAVLVEDSCLAGNR